MQLDTNRPLQPPAAQVLRQESGQVNDVSAVRNWLVIYQIRNANTLRSYRTEAFKFRRFLELLHPERAKTPSWDHLLRDASEMDLALYERALQHEPHEALPRNLFALDADDGAAAPKRTPFSRPLKRSSIDRALAILHAMYAHFMQPGPDGHGPYVIANPVARLISTANRTQGKINRTVPPEVIHEMATTLNLAVAHHSSTGDRIEMARALRHRWIFILLFGLWGRRAEIARLRMGDFRIGPEGWTVDITRKGGKQEALPIGDFVLTGLQDYRISLGLSPLPSPDERTPAIVRLQEKGRRSSTQTVSTEVIYQEARRLASETAARIAAGHGLDDFNEQMRKHVLDQLSKFTPHWFRHTGATVAINKGFMTLNSASKMLGHTSPVITSSMYLEADQQSMRAGIDSMACAVVTE